MLASLFEFKIYSTYCILTLFLEMLQENGIFFLLRFTLFLTFS